MDFVVLLGIPCFPMTEAVASPQTQSFERLDNVLETSCKTNRFYSRNINVKLRYIAFLNFLNVIGNDLVQKLNSQNIFTRFVVTVIEYILKMSEVPGTI